jgi:hypothetical protein
MLFRAEGGENMIADRAYSPGSLAFMDRRASLHDSAFKRPLGREDREGANCRLLRQDRGAESAARHVQWQQLRPARIALPSHGPRGIRAGTFNPALFTGTPRMRSIS